MKFNLLITLVLSAYSTVYAMQAVSAQALAQQALMAKYGGQDITQAIDRASFGLLSRIVEMNADVSEYDRSAAIICNRREAGALIETAQLLLEAGLTEITPPLIAHDLDLADIFKGEQTIPIEEVVAKAKKYLAQYPQDPPVAFH